MSGLNHSEETRKNFSDAHKGLKIGENHPMYGQPRAEGAGSPAIKISVFDQDSKETTVYKSISAAVRALNIPNPQAISNYIKKNQKKPYKGRFIFKIDQKIKYFLFIFLLL